jgi:3-phosphoshikimate 1-carboxyvinyltransferase
MIREIPTVDRFRARLRPPGSKSITNRALVCAALAQGESLLTNASDSDDSAMMANGLNQLGVLVRPSDRGWTVHGTGAVLNAPKLPIPVGNAGTTLRFLLSLAGLASGDTVFDADVRMAERPNDDLRAALADLGVEVTAGGPLPRFVVRGGRVRGGEIRIRPGKSSQFLSSVLLVSPYASGDVTLRIDGPLPSAPYVTMTEKVMAAFGVRVDRPGPDTLRVRAGQRYRPVLYAVESDASSASYFLASAAVTGGEVTIEGLSRESLQGDAGFADVLVGMGCDRVELQDGLVLRGPGRLRGIDIDMNAMPDMVPSLVAAALFAEGPTTVRNVAHLRYKESDRLGTLAGELARLGARIRVREDGLTVEPGPLNGSDVDPHGDHRLAMMFAVVGLRLPGVRVLHPEVVRKSYPGFWSTFLDAAGQSGMRPLEKE